MAVVSYFECIYDICFYFVVIQRGDRGLVDDPGCEAFPFHWTLGFFSTVALSVSDFLLLVQNFFIFGGYLLLYIWRAAVAEFDGVFVEDLAQGGVLV